MAIKRGETQGRLLGNWLLRATVPILLVAAVSCGRATDSAQHTSGDRVLPLSDRIGWLHGSCLAISNQNLSRGTRVALVIMGVPQKLLRASIHEAGATSATCQALMPGRAETNAKPGVFFYSLEAADLGRTDMGIGIVKPPASFNVVNGLARADLDQDGRSEIFSSCATGEGIKFAVWTGKAYQGEPLWSGYYYLDYDAQSTCP